MSDTTSKTKAFAYLRVSGNGQAKEDKDGFPRQRRAIEAHAKAKGLTIVREFIEPGVTGTITERPALGDMLEAIENNGVRVVIVENVNRLARDLVVQETILSDMAARGVRFHSCEAGGDLLALDEPSDEQRATRKLVRQLLGAVAEYDKEMTVLKLRAARRRKRLETGRCEGAKPFGQTDEERRVVATIKKLRRKPKGGKPKGYRAIADILNAAGLPSRRGGKWHDSSVRNVCRSEIYRKTSVTDALSINVASGAVGATD